MSFSDVRCNHHSKFSGRKPGKVPKPVNTLTRETTTPKYSCKYCPRRLISPAQTPMTKGGCSARDPVRRGYREGQT